MKQVKRKLILLLPAGRLLLAENYILSAWLNEDYRQYVTRLFYNIPPT